MAWEQRMSQNKGNETEGAKHQNNNFETGDE